MVLTTLHPPSPPSSSGEYFPPPRVQAAPTAALTGLIWTLIRTDFKARYHGTLGGFVWALLKPLTMFLVLNAVFSLVFEADRTYRLDLIIGLFLWDFFADGTRTGLTSLHTKGFLLSKARFPSSIVVLTSLANPLITVIVFGSVLCLFLTLTGQAPTATSVAHFAAYVAALALIIFGISLAGSVLFLRYRDLNQVWDVVIQAGFFVAPIVYPLAVIPPQYQFWLYAWPPTAVMEFCRTVLVDGQEPTTVAHTYLGAMTFVVLLVGAAVFRTHASRAPEYL
jgi:lipopolysaccharide transport system permease protein